MKHNKKVRIEIRFDAVDDRDMIEFIDNNGSTRAGFIKQVLKMYKNQMELTIPNRYSDHDVNEEYNRKVRNKQKTRRKPSSLNDISFSSKDFE